MNIKLGTAILHSGVGGRQLNSNLCCLNIPPVNHTMLNRRVKESGRAVEQLAKESVDISLQNEVRLQGSKDIEVSVDAGWQKRGSGKSYDSLSGHCTMVGLQTGKVVGFAVRSKHCKTCQVNDVPPSHDCRRNWTGSAKAMEPDMVTEMVVDVTKKGINVTSITGDDDASTIAMVKAKVNKTINKNF